MQQKFLESVEGIDSNNIVKIINMHPYHIDVSAIESLLKYQKDLIVPFPGSHPTLGAVQDVRRQLDGGGAD